MSEPARTHKPLYLGVLAAAGFAALLAWQASPLVGTARAEDPPVQTEKDPAPKPQPAPTQPAREAAKPRLAYWPENVKDDTGAWTGRLVRVDAHLAILTVRGNDAERGMAHGKLLGDEVRRLVASVNKFLAGGEDDAARKRLADCLHGARTMERHVEASVLAELRACAEAAGIDATELLLAQLFGDVNRAKGFRSFCSSFAAFGPATAKGKPIVGRNFDYAGHGLEGGLPLILQVLPAGEGAGRPFTTIGYAGILNGWTALNADGLYASNNTLFGGTDSLEGMSTCFLLRKIVERGRTVEDAVRILRETPRACTTGMLVAGRNEQQEWTAVLVEFDHQSVAVVEPKDGIVLGTNSRQALKAGDFAPTANPSCSRFQALKTLLKKRTGVLSFDESGHNATADGQVYMGINLHCVLLDLEDQSFKLAVSHGDHVPAARNPFRTFRIEAERVVEVKE